MAAPEIVRVPVLADNYAWLVHDPDSGATLVVDPGEAGPVLAVAEARGWSITDVWITHWHRDHTGGVAGVVDGSAAVEVVAPAAEAAKVAAIYPGAARHVSDGDRLAFGAHEARVIATPGHTAGHVSFHLPKAGIAFTGDTLFAMGCGRLFEGTVADMHASLARLAELPDETLVCCGHEYTQANGRYALVAEPDNPAIHSRMNDVDRLRAGGEPTVPSTMALERATNPFLRARSVEELAQRRAAKDSFRG